MSINKHWFNYLKIQIGFSINKEEEDVLLEKLSIQEELLPFLFLKTNIFTGWEKFTSSLIEEANLYTDFSTLRPKSVFDENSELETENLVSEKIGRIIEQDLSKKNIVKLIDEDQENLFMSRDDCNDIFAYRIKSSYN